MKATFWCHVLHPLGFSGYDPTFGWLRTRRPLLAMSGNGCAPPLAAGSWLMMASQSGTATGERKHVPGCGHRERNLRELIRKLVQHSDIDASPTDALWMSKRNVFLEHVRANTSVVAPRLLPTHSRTCSLLGIAFL